MIANTSTQRIVSKVLVHILVLFIANTCQATTAQKLTSPDHLQATTSAQTTSYLNNFNLNPATNSNGDDGDGDSDQDDQDGLYLLGLFDVHAAAGGASRRAPFKCGPIDTDAGETSSRRPMQNLWAFLWAIEQVNADESLLPGVKLGSLVLDTCSSFLRTNQQLANLLHREHDHHDVRSRLPRARQLLGVLADQYDWQSVEATVSMSSSLGLTTFVTQARSTKLSEFARSFHQVSPGQDELPPGNELAGKPLAQVPSDERLLRELLGIGRMLPAELAAPGDTTTTTTTTTSEGGHKSNRLLMIRMAQNNEIIADALASLCDKMKWDLVSVVYDGAQPDLIDLHDELIRQLLLRNIQLAMDEQIATTNANDDNSNYDRLLVNLARQAQIGSRVVLSLLSIGSARQLQARLHQMRSHGQNGASTGGAGAGAGAQLKAINSLLWITTADREPYYTYATDSLGVISASSSSSLLPEFKQFYDQTLKLGGSGAATNSTSGPKTGAPAQTLPPQNRWWPEYVRAIMLRHKRELGELLVNECAHWAEPRASPLPARCAHLNLSSLVQTERSQNQKLARRVGSVDQPTSLKLSTTTTGNANRLSLQRYLASGWEHNGMEVINSVLALANGLESVRQSLCPDARRGLCQRMRDLVRQEQVVVSSSSSAASVKVHDESDDRSAASSIKESGEQLVELPTLSELIHSELIRSTFQLADGQMFSLADSQAGGGGTGQSTATSATQVSPVATTTTTTNTQTQLDARLKFYNLRFLRPNSIGFVKFAQFGGSGGTDSAAAALTLLNATKALHYTNIPMDFNELQPIERVQSTCQDERKCLMLSSFLYDEQPAPVAGARASDDRRRQQKLPISEEELAQGVNSLFKLDHPLISSPSAVAQSTSGASEPNSSGLAIRTMRLKPVVVGLRDPFASDDGPQANLTMPPPLAAARRKPRQFEVIVLLPLSRGGRRREVNIAPSGSKSSTGGGGAAAAAWRASCPSGPEEEAQSFQHLTALAYAQTRAQQLVAALDKRVATTRRDDNKSTSGDGQQPFELTMSVIDYCDHSAASATDHGIGSDNLIEQQVTRLLASRLSARVRDNNNGTQLVAIVDFDWRVSQQVEAIVGESSSPSSGDNNKQAPPVHLTIDHRAHHHGSTAAAAAQVSATGTGTGTGENVQPSAFRINLLPDKRREISAMVSLIAANGWDSLFDNWRLVHLIYAHDQRESRDEFLRQANEAGICVSKLISIPTTTTDQSEPATIPIAARREYQLERTKALFRRELYDFRATGSARSSKSDEANGLNSTRLLVVLASQSAATNRLVLEAATESMLQDYVWITTHEWLASVELPVERAGGVARAPRLFLSTQLESFEGHDFRLFYDHLTPALHGQLPTDWFDRHWQSHFKCILPLHVRSGVGLSAGEPRPPPPCDPRQKLDLDQETQDQQHALYTIRAIEALQLAIASSLQEPTWRQVNFARDFRLAFNRGAEALRPTTGSGTATRDQMDSQGTPLVGFHIVHRLVVDPSRRLETERRANSRQLSDSAGQRLVRVGGFSWHKTYLSRKLAVFGTTLRAAHNKLDLPFKLFGKIPTDRPTIDSDVRAQGLGPPDQDEMRELTRIGDSLEYLAGIKSHCVSKRTCALCQQQVSSARELVRQERARMRLESWEARAMSPLQAADDQDRDQDEDDQDRVREWEREDASGVATKTQPQDDIQAAASSLFSSRTSQQVASELRQDYRALWHSAARDQQRRFPAPSQQQPLRRLSGALLSVLSLVGVICTVASMTYFYPNLLDRRRHKHLAGRYGAQKQQLQSSFRSTSSSTCNIITADGGARGVSSSTGSGRHHNSNAILDNLTDYLMLTGLLMLYSINIAFLLPATLAVCWFRRIGLALSYTLLFSAILAKIHEVHARQPTTAASKRRRRAGGSSSDSRLGPAGVGANSQQVVNRSHQSLESVDESVEVTFESLPHETGESSSAASSSSSYHRQAGELHNQRHLVGADRSESDARPHTTPSDECAMGHAQDRSATTDYFRAPLALIVLQTVVALIWLVRQPPEPTLFHACWHCASLMRSPLMFLYEPLMSLLEPAAILIVGWLWSIHLFNRAFSQERQFALASREFLASQPLSFTLTNSPEYLRHRQLSEQLASQLRDSKLLVTTTTLLILLWSLMTLNIVSSSQALLGALSSVGGGGAQTISQQQQQHLDDQSLLYTNLASGALVFGLLFVHRLRLFRTGSASLSPLDSKCDYDQISSNSEVLACAAGKRHRNKSVQSISRRLKSFGRSRRFTTTTTTTTGGDETLGVNSDHKTLNRAPAQQQAERLKLQQFNMTYGTYAPAAFGASTSCDGQQVGALSGELATSQIHQAKASQNKKRGADKSMASDSRSSSTRSLFKLTAGGGGKRAAADKNNNNKSETGNGVTHHVKKNKKLQQQVGGAFSSSRHSLNGSLSLADDGDSDLDLELPDPDHLMMSRGWRGPAGDQDNLSCASNATSQLQGNDLYPIDCSIQLADNIGPPPPPPPRPQDKQLAGTNVPD